MASMWKYSSVPAKERLRMIRNGDEDVYKSEIARSVDTANSRKNLGLDISEQKKWIDNISYSYNLYNAERMGISEYNINKTGYADRLLEESAGKGGRKYVTTVGRTATLESRAKKLLGEYYDKVSAYARKRDGVVEWLYNNGIDNKSEDGRKYLEKFDRAFDSAVESYQKEYATKLKKLANS